MQDHWIRQSSNSSLLSDPILQVSVCISVHPKWPWSVKLQFWCSFNQVMNTLSWLTSLASKTRNVIVVEVTPSFEDREATTINIVIGHFRVHLSLSAKSLLWKLVFIHIEIRTIYHDKNFALRLALKERLRGTRIWPIYWGLYAGSFD